MKPLDYARSFLIGKWPENEVRFWVESRTRIIDGDKSEDYQQCGSCKSEDTFAEHDLFYAENYDFLPIFGPEWGVIFRRRKSADDGYKSCVRAEEMWGGQQYRLAEATVFEALESADEIIHATHAARPLVGQTEIANEETGLRAVFEYPVKTMNVHRGRRLFQVDTGPLAFPDLSGRAERHVDRIALAFIAWNAPDFADFVVEVPVDLPGGDTVYHYSRRASLRAENRLFALG